MSCRILTVLLLFLCPLVLRCQEYSYSHYDSKDGLGSSTVYCTVQDKDGFLWFGTESGLTRYDGTHFLNFTQDDGLPDNDIIQLFADSKRRVWIAPFKKTVCYYYNGKIHNRNNDTILKKLRIHDNVVRFAEDEAGNLLLQEVNKLHLVQPDGKVSTFTGSDTGKPFRYISQIGKRKEGGYWIVADASIYVLKDKQVTLWQKIRYEWPHFNFSTLSPYRMTWRSTLATISTMSLQDNKIRQIPSPYGVEFINFSMIDDRYLGVCLQTGALVYDVNDLNKVQRYLPGVTISGIFKDSEGSWWFTTIGKGVYRLNSGVVLSVRNQDRESDRISENTWYASKEWHVAKKTWKLIQQHAGVKDTLQVIPAFTWYNAAPLVSMLTLNNNQLAIGTRYSVMKMKPPLTNSFYKEIVRLAVKAMCLHKNTVLVATPWNVMAIDQQTWKIVDTIWHERATCIFSKNDAIYIGTVNSLYRLTPDKKVQNLSEKIKVLQSRIAAINEDDNHVLWVATSGTGLIGWRNGQVIHHFTRFNGLSSNICRALFYENGKLWVGTDKGLNKIEVLQPGYPIDKYSTSDGLSSDIINSVYVASKNVFVGTPEGLTFFDEEKIASQSQCMLRFLHVTVGDTTYYPADAPTVIPHKQNRVQFKYVGISFKSNGDIRYRYRLLGLDSAWHETRETFLSYPTLPSGDYQLQLQAFNKFDVASNILTTGFTIEKLLYEKTWFRILIGLLFLTLTGLLVALIIRRIKNREREKTTFVKRINELEQLSRKAQMNPHFIFNSLNSIQQYVMDSDVAGANRFIAGFSRLIRQTLDFSSKPEISLEEELAYLTNYLELEKTRLENAFAWSVSIERGVSPDEYYIPPMILQPFVENSVRHGLRYRRDKNGIVTITVKREGDHLICILEDNGIGRKAAMAYKSVSPINYQSKGLSLTADRITMFNKEHEKKISMKIDDLEDSNNQALGTRVTICFPVL